MTAAITNGITVSAVDRISVANTLAETNKLTLTVNRNTGVVIGSFANPNEPKQAVKLNGVILQGQSNVQGYFLDTNQSEEFLL